MKKFIAGLLAMCLIPLGVNAAEQPTYIEGGVITRSSEVFFANGTPITIEDRTDGIEGALIKWNGGEQAVLASANIFGGGHGSDTRYDTTSITMNGGTVRLIFGGGLHKSDVGTTNVTINGGVYDTVQGGGASSFTDKCHGEYYNGDAKQSPNRVEKANVIINGGEGKSVYGGNEGIGYTKNAYIEVNGGKITDTITASGSNGYTGNSAVVVTGGTIDTIRGILRGSMDTVDVAIEGGEVKDLYVGGNWHATEHPSVTGTINTSANVDISGGKVTNLYAGTKGANEAATDIVKATYNEKYVENVDTNTFDADSVTKTVTLTFVAEGERESIEVPYGFAFTKEQVDELINTLREELKVEGYTIDDFYQDEALTTKYDLTKPIEEEATVYMKLVELKSETPAPQEIKNAKTGDMNLIMILSLLGVAGVAVVLTGKKALLNNNI